MTRLNLEIELPDALANKRRRQVCSNRMLLSGWCVRRCLPGE
jgi:hypothetical protein